MTFTSPLWLLALLAIPLALGLQWASRARGRRYAVRFPATSTLALAAGEVPIWRRVLPGALALTAVGVLVLSLARPSKAVRVPVRSAQIVLVTDHSGSMSADDVQPSRLAAAEKAADTFIDQLPKSAKVGVVAYSDSPDVVQAPSTDHSRAREAIGAQIADGSTATGDALQAALDMLKQSHTKLPSAIVLLSDGATTAGRDPVPVAQAAARQHVAIDTVALGKPGAVINTPGGAVDVSPDPETLQAIAKASNGQAFTAGDASHLSSIYKSLGSQLGTQTRHHDISSGFALAGLALLLSAGLASVALAGRLP
jgi:Ca-activated chloride channel family protein